MVRVINVYFTRDYDQFNNKMATGWSNNATRALLAIWGEENIQEQLDGVARNRDIYEKSLIVFLSRDLNIHGSSVGLKLRISLRDTGK